MSKIVRIYKSKIEGEISISGAKNSSLRLLAGSILTQKNVFLKNIPSKIKDVETHINMLESLGKTIDIQDEYVIIRENNLKNNLVWEGYSIRNTLLILGALLTRTGSGRVPLPGGCKIGERKYDLHKMAMEKFGAEVWEEGNYLCAKSSGRLKAADIYLPIRSTGATENCILMACLAEGITRVRNPHIRPEILDLIAMLNKMGAKIRVSGNESIEIEGVESLKDVTHECIFDSVEALTYLIASAITGGEILINNFPAEQLEIPLIYLRESGLNFFLSPYSKSVIQKNSTIYPIEIATGPYPSINSDMQPIFAAFACKAKGESKIVDLRFPGRYQYMNEFKKLQVDCSIEGDLLKIIGGSTTTGTSVEALDLRTGASLLLLGLISEGETLIHNFEQVERGYQYIVENMKKLNAKVDYIN